jgi:hypothetical protein
LKTDNRVGTLKAEYDVQLTFEGDNNVLMQQVWPPKPQWVYEKKIHVNFCSFCNVSVIGLDRVLNESWFSRSAKHCWPITWPLNRKGNL